MKTFFLLIAFFSVCSMYSQTPVTQEIKAQTNSREQTGGIGASEDSTLEADSSLIVLDEWDANFNNLLNSWYVKHYTSNSNILDDDSVNISTSDSVYMERLSKLPNIIELPYNSTVRKCIDLYVERRKSVEYMLGLGTFYFPMIEETLDKYGLPLELKYLVVVESAMNPSALSRAGASGLWQFIISTGKIYGLEINNLIDERRDPIKSTDAACRHLKDLYDTFQDWSLALAAYNCGGGNVIKAIKRSGGKKDYWAIYPYLPRETRSYVPLFIATNYIMNYYASYQLSPVQISLPLATDTVMVNQMIHFDQIADILHIDKDLIRALNPQYKRDIIPGNFQSQILKLPAMQAYAFVEKENEIVNYRADELFTNRKYVDISSIEDRREKIIHRVKSGETVTTIANKYGVTSAEVRKWNGLRSNRVPKQKRLILYVNNGGYAVKSNDTANVKNTALKAGQYISVPKV